MANGMRFRIYWDSTSNFLGFRDSVCCHFSPRSASWESDFSLCSELRDTDWHRRVNSDCVFLCICHTVSGSQFFRIFNTIWLDPIRAIFDSFINCKNLPIRNLLNRILYIFTVPCFKCRDWNQKNFMLRLKRSSSQVLEFELNASSLDG